MAPTDNQICSTTIAPRSDPALAANVKTQWTNPSDILSLLLILGGDVIQRALAQQTGDRWPAPVVFSFGWVAYSFTGLLAAVGDNVLLPAPDLSAIVFSVGFGHVRNNQSWILGRLLRDFENSWMPADVKKPLISMLQEFSTRQQKAGLCISVFDASEDAPAGTPHRDFYWYSGYLVAVAQLAISVVPWVLWNDPYIFIIAVCGTLLAFTTGSLPQWRRERWACRRDSKKTFVLSRGNGAQHVLVIRGEGRGLDLEDLASSAEKVVTSYETRCIYAALAILWVVLLITVSGMRVHTWFLIAVGALGMVHTVIIAGAPRRPEVFGIPLKFREVFVDRKVMEVLQKAETKYPGLGRTLVPAFFPGGLREDEQAWWKRARENESRLQHQ